MSKVIPNELFNAVDVPSGNTAVRISDYLKSISFRVPSCSDIMMEREMWNTVCDFSERCGALREKQSGTLNATKVMTITTPTYGELQRFVGAGLGSSSVGINEVSFTDTSATFSQGTSGGQAYVCYSVIPDINAVHDVTKVGSAYPNDNWKVPQWFAREYQKLLVSGTMFRLLGMTGRPWTDFNGARANALVYNREINRVTHGLITAGMRKQALIGEETVFVGNAQQASTTTTTTSNQ